MANTYAYTGPGTRWAEEDPTAEDYLNVSRINCDHLHEALNTITNSAAADGIMTGSWGAGAAGTPSIAPNGDSNTGIWFPAADTVAISTGGTERIRVASGGGTLHVRTATAGSVTASTSHDDLVVENSGAVGITMLGGTNDTATLVMGDADDNDRAFIQADLSANTLAFSNNGGAAFTMYGTSANLGLHETANANMTTGITINQTSSDDKLFALKSSDVAHGFTGVMETDSYFTLGKYNGANGGTYLNSVREDSAGPSFSIDAYGGTADTTHSSAVVGLFDHYVSEHDGANSSTDITANGMVYTFRGRVGSANRALFGIDEDGDFQYDGADGGAWDAYDDAHICRAMATATLDPKTIVRSKWDEMVKYDKQTMIDIGVLGYCSPEDAAEGHAGLVNGSQLQRVFMGAHWQAYMDRMELREVCDLQQEQIESIRAELKLLSKEN